MKYIKNIIVLLLKILSFMSIMLGSITFFFGIACNLDFIKIENQIELPLGYPKSIAIDEQGRIYCHLQFYHRIQLYDCNGNFIKAWHIDKGDNLLLQSIDEKHLEVIDVDDLKIYYLTNNKYGDIILSEARELPANFDNQKVSNYLYEHKPLPLTYKDNKGNVYSICMPFFNTYITKKSLINDISVVIRMTPLQLLLSGPFVSFILIFTGLLILSFIHKIENFLYPKAIIVPVNSKNNKYSDFFTIMVSLRIYLFLDIISVLLGIITGSIFLIWTNINLTFFVVTFSIAISIIIFNVFFHRIFKAKCLENKCNGECLKVKDVPLVYKCKKCGNIYSKGLDDI